jgi:hypothetical protein
LHCVAVVTTVDPASVEPANFIHQPWLCGSCERKKQKQEEEEKEEA